MNLNDIVYVKLTDHGRHLMRQNHTEFWAGRRAPYEFKLPREDAQGWSPWQLWHLMQEFGPHIYLGGDNAFDLELRTKQDLEAPWAPAGFDLDKACNEALQRVNRFIDQATEQASVEIHEGFMQARTDIVIRHLSYTIAVWHGEETAGDFLQCQHQVREPISRCLALVGLS